MTLTVTDAIDDGAVFEPTVSSWHSTYVSVLQGLSSYKLKQDCTSWPCSLTGTVTWLPTWASRNPSVTWMRIQREKKDLAIAGMKDITAAIQPCTHLAMSVFTLQQILLTEIAKVNEHK